MKKLLLVSMLALALSPFATLAQAGHEYSPLVEKTVNYKNWSLVNLKTDKADELRSLMKGKKLVMVVYFAPWCGNWRNEAPIAAGAALRDTSAIFAILIAVLWLKEPFTKLRLVAIVLSAAAIPLLRFA